MIFCLSLLPNTSIQTTFSGTAKQDLVGTAKKMKTLHHLVQTIILILVTAGWQSHEKTAKLLTGLVFWETSRLKSQSP